MLHKVDVDIRKQKQLKINISLTYQSLLDFDIVEYKKIAEMQDHEKILQYLMAAEKLAEEILSNKQEIIMLDKRRNQNREALRELIKSNQQKCWVTVGSVLIKHKFQDAKSLLEADQKQLNIDINKLRSDIKVKVNGLRDLEMQPPVAGLMLVPMTAKEAEALSSSKLLPS